MQNCKSEYYNSYFPDGLKLNNLQNCPMDGRQNFNIVKDYRTLENQQDPGMVSLRQNVSTKHVRVENNTSYNILIGIGINRCYKMKPEPQFLLRGGEVRDLAINLPSDVQQYIWTYSPETGRVLGDPHPMKWYINTFVINSGDNRFWIMDMQNAGFIPKY